MIKALVFDFDGLILETELPILQSFQELFEAHGLKLTFEQWANNIGTAEESFDAVQTLERHLGRSLKDDPLLEQRQEREMELILTREAMPGAEQILKEARRLGLKIGLASSSTCQWVTGHLERLGLIGYFDCIQAKDDVRLTKPDPALFRSAVEVLGVQPGEAIAFEDSPNGILAAKRAGLHCVAVPNVLTRNLDTSQADLQLESLDELPLEALIATIEGRAGQPGA